jgi:UDP-N-acetylenolpyruvoylglucosamine reductase
MNQHNAVLESAIGGKSSLTAELRTKMSPKSVIRCDEPLAKRTTLRVGGPADLYVEPASEEDLAMAVRFCGERHLPMFLLGHGSNILVRDGGFRGVVICLAHPHFKRIEATGYRLACGAGAKLKSVANEAKRRGLTGLEFLAGIPGSVGGALHMNAGAMGAWIFDVVETVRFMDLDGRAHELERDKIEVEYRACRLFKDHIALSAVLKGQPAVCEVIEERMRTFSQKRWQSQPTVPSAGCVFKNPPTVPAGKLVDELGLKGTRVGGAVVSPEHGNFIVTEAGAKAADVLALIEVVKQRARMERGIELEMEVEIVGQV